MKAIINLSIAMIIFYTLFPSNAQADAGDKYLLRVRDRTVISYDQLIKDMRDSRLIFIGEYHDSEAHHRFQLDIIKELKKSNIPIAVGLEMFTAKSQGILDFWIKGKISEDGFIKAYYSNWGVPWTYYNDIFLYLRDNGVPAVGLNVSDDLVQKVSTSGFSSLTGAQLKFLPARIACNVDRNYMDIMKMAYAAHDHKSKHLQHFCEAQLLWDKGMAQNLSEFMNKNRDRTVVVLAGSNHAWKKGVPAHMENQLNNLKYTVILAGLSGYMNPATISPEDADYILLTQTHRK